MCVSVRVKEIKPDLAKIAKMAACTATALFTVAHTSAPLLLPKTGHCNHSHSCSVGEVRSEAKRDHPRACARMAACLCRSVLPRRSRPIASAVMQRRTCTTKARCFSKAVLASGWPWASSFRGALRSICQRPHSLRTQKALPILADHFPGRSKFCARDAYSAWKTLVAFAKILSPRAAEEFFETGTRRFRASETPLLTWHGGLVFSPSKLQTLVAISWRQAKVR